MRRLFRSLLVAGACVPAAAAQEPVVFTTENRLALDAYYGGRLEEAERRWSACASLVPPAVTGAQRSTTAANLASVLERLGQREAALAWALRSADGASLGQRGWFRAQESLEGLCNDDRYGAIEAALARAETQAVEQREAKARGQRAVMAAAREAYADSNIVWQNGHSGPVVDMKFSPGGDRLVSGGRDGTIRLWSTRIDEPSRTITLGTGSRVRLEYGPGGESILVLDPDAMTAEVFDGVSGDFSLALSGDLLEPASSDDFVLDAAFGRDGRVWTVTGSGRLRLWDVRRGRTDLDLDLGFLIEDVEVSPDGERLLVLGEDGRARLCDARSGDVRGGVGSPGLTVTQLSFLPDGRVLLGGADDFAHVHGDDLSRPVTSIPLSANELLWPSADGRRVMTLGEGKSLLLWDTHSGELVATLLPPGSGVKRVASGPDGIIAAAHRPAGTEVGAWDAATGDQIGYVIATTSASELAFDAQGRLAIATWSEIVLIDKEGGQGRALASRSGRIKSAWVGAEGRIVTGLKGGFPVEFSDSALWRSDLPGRFRFSTRRWSLTSGGAEPSAPGYGTRPIFAPNGVDLLITSTSSGSFLERADGTRHQVPVRTSTVGRMSPDGSRCVMTHATGQGWVVLVACEGEDLRPVGGHTGLSHTGSQEDILPASFSPDGELVILCTDGFDVLVADGHDMTEVERLRGHRGALTCTDFDSAGGLLATSSADGTTRIWTFFPGASELNVTLEGHEGTVWCCAFGPDDDVVATCGVDGTARIWDTASGEQRAVLRGHGGAVRRLAFHPLTGHLVTVAFDGTARIWDVQTGEQLHVLRGHTGPLRGLDFAEDGRIVTWGEDTTVRVWSADGRLLATRVEYDEQGWLLFEPGGRYVSGGRADEWAQVQVDGGIFPLSCYRAFLEDEQAVLRSLAGEIVPPAPAPPGAPEITTTTAATGTVSAPGVEIAAFFEDRNGLAEISIERNGELWWSGLERPELVLERGARQGTLELTVPFPDGATHMEVRVRATNRRDIKSVPLTIVRDYQVPSGDLFLITVAVADYDGDRLDLAAPLRDAAALAKRMATEQGDLYDTVHHWPLDGAGVTQAALGELLLRLLDECSEEDSVVVFVAGHGALDRAGRYFFLTPDATPERPLGGIPRDQIESLVTYRDLAARRRVLLIDTCHAGGGDGWTNRGIGADEAFTQNEVDDLVGGGLYIVAGSSKLGAARETGENGVFTRALLDGLDGAADDGGNRNGTVDIAEWIAYARKTVLEADGPQRVTTPTVVEGDPFPIARSKR